jgi:hypothetical protein
MEAWNKVGVGERLIVGLKEGSRNLLEVPKVRSASKLLN